MGKSGGEFCQLVGSTHTRRTADICHAGFEKLATILDPDSRADQLDTATERADAAVARIYELEQQLKAAKSVSRDAGGDKIVELLTNIEALLVENNKRLQALEDKRPCCSIM